jgi:anti-sigma regulatory factor (Ser/Thr protein kinase)
LTLPARAVLLLYTDGLVERRHTGLDDGIAEVCALLHESRDAELEHLASQIMQRLAPSDGYEDDVALLLYRHPGPLQIDFPADVNRLADVRNSLRNWLIRAEVDADQIHDVLIAAGEAVSNSIEHGHRESPEGVIRLRATVGAEVVRLAIVDSGTWKPPRSAAQRHRGRGIQLMQALMQDVTIDRETDGTTVHLTARIV